MLSFHKIQKPIGLCFAFYSLFALSAYAQNVLNPYIDYNGLTPPLLQIPNVPPSVSHVYSLHPSQLDDKVYGWTGEYEIAMMDHFWHRDADIRNNHAISVIIESASFPFLPPCAADVNGCADDPNNS